MELAKKGVSRAQQSDDQDPESRESFAEKPGNQRR